MRSISSNLTTLISNRFRAGSGGVKFILRRCCFLCSLVGCILSFSTYFLWADQLLTEGQHFKDCPVCPEMVVIPAGKTTVELMDEKGRISEPYTLHVESSFAIAIHETRIADWENCEFDGGCERAALSRTQNKTDFGWREWKGTHPVTNVTWSESVGYALWLSSITGERYWLPSEVEWEYAGRGGWTQDQPWRNWEKSSCEFSNLAAHSGCSDRYKATSPVGSYGPNPFGLYDIIGNVSEWTASCSGSRLVGSSGYGKTLYPKLLENGVPLSDLGAGIIGCDAMVYRGGDWFSEAIGMRFSSRVILPRGEILETLGFRVMRFIQ